MVLEKDVDVLEASRGEDGFAMACDAKPDVIIVDVLLPDLDGLSLCRRLQEPPATANIPLIVLTGDDRAYARAVYERSETMGVLSKPCRGDRLLSSIHAAVARAKGPV